MTEAEARRRVTLLALRDAEYDFATGKLDETDYQALKRQLSAEALAALEELERSGGRDAVEAEIAEARKELKEGMRCPACRHLNPGGSRFCGACGVALASQEPAGAP